MVQIRIIPKSIKQSQPKKENDLIDNIATASDPIDHTNRKKDEEHCTIIALAKGCAATQIQAVYRGVRCRQNKYKDSFSKRRNIRNDELLHPLEYDSKVQNAALTIQRFCKVVLKSAMERLSETKSKYIRLLSDTNRDVSIQTDESNMGHQMIEMNTQTDNKTAIMQGPNTEPEQHSSATDQREDIIKSAYECCLNNILRSIELSGFETLNVLQAMSVLGFTEYEILLKVLLSSKNDSSNNKFRQPSSRYTVRLDGDIEDFEEDINAAWTSLSKRALDMSPGTASVFLRKKDNRRLKFHSSSHVARTHLQQLISLSKESLLILEQNEDILSYDRITIEKYLLSLGLDHKMHLCDDKGQHCDWTVIDFLKAINKSTSEQSSFEQTKTKAALEVIGHVVEWENSLCSQKNPKKDKLFEFKSKHIMKQDSTILKLQQEIACLKIKLAEIGTCNQYTKTDEIGEERIEIDGEMLKSCDNSTKRPLYSAYLQHTNNKTKTSEAKQSSSSLHHPHSSKSYPKRRRGKAKQNSKQHKGPVLNRVEIKFCDLVENENNAKVPTTSFRKHHEKDLPSSAHLMKRTQRTKQASIRKPKPKLSSTKESAECYSRKEKNLSLAETIAKARDKISLRHQTTGIASWSTGVRTRTYQDETFCDSKSKRKPFGVVPDSCNKREDPSTFKKSADERFNGILEKLRKSANSAI